VVLGAPSCGLDTLRQFHVDICLYGSLRISHNKINLTKSPTEDDERLGAMGHHFKISTKTQKDVMQKSQEVVLNDWMKKASRDG
jgi:hypothetical protein